VLSQLPQSHMEAQVHQYAEIVAAKAQQILPKAGGIHAHDWMSFPAALKLKRASGKPMIAHIHSTEVDRIPFGRGSDYILQTEYDGMLQADVVVAVSHYTKRLLHQYYDVPEEKIVVIHNGIDPLAQYPDIGRHHFAHKRPVIAFMGRLTAQKGAEYFLSLGRSVLNRLPHALFIVAGSGDMYHQLILTSAAEQLTASVLFSGFVRDKQRDQLLNRADVFVMPSLSEPFGLVALEAAQRHTPVILSKTVGASEVLPHSVTADFWDVNKMSEHVCALISDTGYRESVIQGQLNDLEHITWDRAAQKIDNLYADIF
jgi:glycogen(starch) synthase